MIYLVSVVMVILVALAVSIHIWLRKRENKQKHVLVIALNAQQSSRALPADVFTHLQEVQGITMNQGRFIHLVHQLVRDGLVQKHELSRFDRARLARKSLKGVCSFASGQPIQTTSIMARLSLTQEGLQHAA